MRDGERTVSWLQRWLGQRRDQLAALHCCCGAAQPARPTCTAAPRREVGWKLFTIVCLSSMYGRIPLACRQWVGGGVGGRREGLAVRPARGAAQQGPHRKRQQGRQQAQAVRYQASQARKAGLAAGRQGGHTCAEPHSIWPSRLSRGGRGEQGKLPSSSDAGSGWPCRSAEQQQGPEQHAGQSKD